MHIPSSNDLVKWVLGTLLLRFLKQVLQAEELRTLGERLGAYIESRFYEPPQVCGRTGRLAARLYIFAVYLPFSAYFLVSSMLIFALAILRPGVGIGQRLAGLALALAAWFIADWYRNLAHREWRRLQT